MNVDLRLAIPAGAAWVTAAVFIGVPAGLPFAACIAWVLAGIAVIFLRRPRARQVFAVIAVALALCGLVLTIAAVRAPERQPAALDEAAKAGRYLTAEATTTQTVLADGGPFAVTLTRVSIGVRSWSTNIPALVFGAPSTTERIGIGSSLRLSGSVSPTDAGDDTAYLFFSARPPVFVAGPPWWLSWADQLRAGFGRTASTLAGDGGDLLPGLAIGDTSAVSGDLDAAMKASSLSHLTAVSGANCAVVVGLVMLGGAALGLSRRARIAASVIVLAGFVVLVTPEPSVLRAAVMAVIVLGAMSTGRPVLGVPVLSLATIVLLVIDPWLARSYGFVLSVLATAGLLVLSGPLARMLARILPRWLAVLVSIPLAAQLACQPVLILLNPSIPTYGVLANILAEPAAPIATIVGLLACVTLPFAPPLGHALALIAWVPATWIASVATLFDSLPARAIPWFEGAVGVAAVAALTFVALWVSLRQGSRRTRAVGAAVLALTLVVYLGVSGGERLRVQLSRPADWQIAACDIGQGDAVLVRSEGLVALVDTGPDPALLTRCLDELGIDRIDLLVLSHFDSDHVGGTSAVMGLVGTALVGPPDGSQNSELGPQLAAAGAHVVTASRGLSGSLGELRWKVLWPRHPLAGVEPGNDASVAVEFSGAGSCVDGCLDALFLGDLGDRPQALMLAANPQLGQVDVVKVAHHGSSDQDDRLYSRVHATVGIVSVGADNTYGHPTNRLLGILKKVGTAITRTDLEGMVLLSPRSDGTVSVWTEKGATAAQLEKH